MKVSLLKSMTSILALASLLVLTSCSNKNEEPAPSSNQGNNSNTKPTIGIGAAQQHAYRVAPSNGIITTDAVTTQASGSVLLSVIARGTWSLTPDAPTDNHNNAFILVESAHSYQEWPDSKSALYVKTGAAGGTNHTFSVSFGKVGSEDTDGDEVSISMVEVKGATKIQMSSFAEKILPGGSTMLTSEPVTTTGPAVLVAWWWGTAGIPPVGQNHTAIPGNGFTLIPEATRTVRLNSNGYIQFAAAYKIVDGAGTYAASWTTTENAQLYLVAVE